MRPLFRNSSGLPGFRRTKSGLCSIRWTLPVIVLVVFLCVLNSTELQDFLHLNDRAGVPYIGGSLGLNHSLFDLMEAYKLWDDHVGCDAFKEREEPLVVLPNPSLQDPDSVRCGSLRAAHVSILVKEWRWLPNNLDNLYSCRCGLTCTWTKSEVLADHPDAMLYETGHPPRKRAKGDPLRVYMDLEPGRISPGHEDIFISYHAGDTVQATYAGASFHVHRSYFTSSVKRSDVLVYWSSSHCVPERTILARKILKLLPHHSFGKCLNNVGGSGEILKMYPNCRSSSGSENYWAYHLHCAMSYYKFVLAIENTMTESYVTEKLFYALDAGAIPIYFGASNVKDLVPPHSIIEGNSFDSMESLAAYVKQVSSDPILYAEYHAWRRCGIMGHYHQTRAVSLDSLPCRLCAAVSKLGGRDYEPSAMT